MATAIFPNQYKTGPSKVYVMIAEMIKLAAKIGLGVHPDDRARKGVSLKGKANVSVAVQSKRVARDLAEGIEHMAQVYAYVKYGKLYKSTTQKWCESGTSEWFPCTTKQAQAMIMNAFKMAKKLDYDVLALTTYALDYMEKNNKREPKDWTRWIEYVRFAQTRTKR